MGAAVKFKNTEVPRQASETGRIKIIQGPDAGAVFVIRGGNATIGRGEENDIVITDLKSSRRHAEFVLTGAQWAVRDLGSANGISVNGKSSRASAIRTGDVLSLGETTLEFIGGEAGTVLLKAVPKSMAEIEANQAAFHAQQEKVRQLAQFGGAARAPALPGKQPEKSTRLPLVVGALGILIYVFMGSSTPNLPAQGTQRPTQSLASYLPQSNVPLSKSAEVFFREGFREYRNQNFLRAQTEFETALQISPGNSLAQLYLDNCKQAIQDAVKFDLDSGKKDYEAGDLKDAKLHYESVMRLLYRDQSNPSFIEAREQLVTVTKEMSEDQ